MLPDRMAKLAAADLCNANLTHKVFNGCACTIIRVFCCSSITFAALVQIRRYTFIDFVKDDIIRSNNRCISRLDTSVKSVCHLVSSHSLVNPWQSHGFVLSIQLCSATLDTIATTGSSILRR